MASILAPIQPDYAFATATYKDGTTNPNWTANLAHNDRVVSLTDNQRGKTYHTADSLRADGIKEIIISYKQQITI